MGVMRQSDVFRMRYRRFVGRAWRLGRFETWSERPLSALRRTLQIALDEELSIRWRDEGATCRSPSPERGRGVGVRAPVFALKRVHCP